jgi:undecaprenyl-diphosphatase
MRMIAPGVVDRLTSYELPLCRLLNRVENRAALALFRAVSWLGDWRLWAALGLVLAGFEGLSSPPVRQMALLSMVCLPIYKVLKLLLARERPFVEHAGIHQLVAPLDRYSFPSGHTLHAVAFTAMLIPHYPELAWPLIPFTTLVALSRVILGMHYPSDVLAGAVLGGVLAGLSFTV